MWGVELSLQPLIRDFRKLYHSLTPAMSLVHRDPWRSVIDLRLPHFAPPADRRNLRGSSLKRANAPPARPVWKDDDYDVLADGKVEGEGGHLKTESDPLLVG
jgi:hypothetical protein